MVSRPQEIKSEAQAQTFKSMFYQVNVSIWMDFANLCMYTLHLVSLISSYEHLTFGISHCCQDLKYLVKLNWFAYWIGCFMLISYDCYGPFCWQSNKVEVNFASSLDLLASTSDSIMHSCLQISMAREVLLDCWHFFFLNLHFMGFSFNFNQ